MRRTTSLKIASPGLALIAAFALFAPSSAGAQALRDEDRAIAAAPIDSDDDGLADRDESLDTDGDGVVDALDRDDDNDGVPTREERPTGVDRDTDSDGVADHLDRDDDNDGVPTRDERDRDASRDTDGDGIADHLDSRDDRSLDSPVIPSLSAGTVAADIDGDGRGDVLPTIAQAQPASAPSRRSDGSLPITAVALGIGAVISRRKR